MNYPSEFQQAGQIDGRIKHALNEARKATNIASGGALGSEAQQRDRSPVEQSSDRLLQNIGRLLGQIDRLEERLVAVSLPFETCAGEASNRLTGTCQLVQTLDDATARVEQAAQRLESARERLCI